MKIEVLITEQPLVLTPVALPGCGAVARFDGLVREVENEKIIFALKYEAYQPMAENTVRKLLEGLHGEHPFELVRVQHRIGWVPVGQAAIVMDVHTKHRAEAFTVLQKFMNLLKQEVPIWKTEVRTTANDDGN